MRVAILTISDRAHAGDYEDKTGPAIERAMRRLGEIEQITTDVIADEQEVISKQLVAYADSGFDLVLTNGGTGLAPRDVTPEATAAVVDRAIPGIAEAMRFAGRANTPLADLSRGMAGHRKSTLIINLPGSPKGAGESLDAIIELIPHAVATLQGTATGH